MSFISKSTDSDIIELNYNLRITMSIGLERLRVFEEFLDSLTPQSRYIKILLDFTGITFDCEDTHLTLSKMSRELIARYTKGIVIFANLQTVYDNPLSEYEQWFTSRDAAINWLNTFE